MNTFRRFFSVLALLAVVLASFVTNNASAAGMNTLAVETSTGKVEWTVELASDNDSRSRGLMFRKSMDEGAGMLFRFDQTGPVSMWMKNTVLPLDMVFGDEAGTITHIHRGAVPYSTAIISSNGPVRFVLELNAGQVDKAGIKVGDRMIHPWFLPLN